MDEDFGPAALAIVIGDADELATLLDADPGLATRTSTVSHPTLLQLVACEAANIEDPIASVQLLVDHGAYITLPLTAAAGCGSCLGQSILRPLIMQPAGTQCLWYAAGQRMQVMSCLPRSGTSKHAMHMCRGQTRVSLSELCPGTSIRLSTHLPR